MAYSRKRKSSGGRRKGSSAARSRRKTTSRGSAGYTPRKRARRKSSGSRRAVSARAQTFKIVLEQAQPQTLNPLKQALIDQGKAHTAVAPRKARF